MMYLQFSIALALISAVHWSQIDAQPVDKISEEAVKPCQVPKLQNGSLTRSEFSNIPVSEETVPAGTFLHILCDSGFLPYPASYTICIGPGEWFLAEPSCKRDECPGRFRCHISRECLPIHYRCDSVVDCRDNTDEKDCPTLPEDDCNEGGPQCSTTTASLPTETTSPPNSTTTEVSEDYSICGKGAGKNSDVTTIEEYPWLAYIDVGSRKRDNAEILTPCGGVLISDTWILTAAHCVYNESNLREPVEEVFVTLGHSDVSKSSLVRTAKFREDVFQSTKIYTHPDFNDYNLDNDFALIELPDPVVFSSKIRPICLPDKLCQDKADLPSFLADKVDSCHEVVVGGWGYIDETLKPTKLLHETELNITACTYKNEKFTNSHFCAASVNASVCEGYTGSPLMCESDDKMHILGVSSWGKIACGVNGPAVFARICSAIKWIRQTAGLNRTSSQTMVENVTIKPTTTVAVPEQPKCGMKRRNGARFPFMAYLRNAEGLQACSGVIISNRWILTSAQCLSVRKDPLQRELEIIVGRSDVTDNTTGQVLRSSKFYRHPAFDWEELKNDLGLIKLESPLTFSSNIGSICLPTEDNCEGSDETHVGPDKCETKSIVVGWEMTTGKMHWEDVFNMNSYVCRVFLSSRKTISWSVFPERQLCAGHWNKNLCGHESGGPLVCRSNRRTQVVGIASWPLHCNSAKPGVFSRVCSGLSWIEETMQQN